MDIKLGDRVIFIRDSYDCKRLKNFCGKVIKIYPGGNYIGIQFDKNINGHECDGLGRKGYCWCCPSSYVRTLKIQFK